MKLIAKKLQTKTPYSLNMNTLFYFDQNNSLKYTYENCDGVECWTKFNSKGCPIYAINNRIYEEWIEYDNEKGTKTRISHKDRSGVLKREFFPKEGELSTETPNIDDGFEYIEEEVDIEPFIFKDKKDENIQ